MLCQYNSCFTRPLLWKCICCHSCGHENCEAHISPWTLRCEKTCFSSEKKQQKFPAVFMRECVRLLDDNNLFCSEEQNNITSPLMVSHLCVQMLHLYPLSFFTAEIASKKGILRSFSVWDPGSYALLKLLWIHILIAKLCHHLWIRHTHTHTVTTGGQVNHDNPHFHFRQNCLLRGQRGWAVDLTVSRVMIAIKEHLHRLVCFLLLLSFSVMKYVTLFAFQIVHLNLSEKKIQSKKYCVKRVLWLAELEKMYR